MKTYLALFLFLFSLSIFGSGSIIPPPPPVAEEGVDCSLEANKAHEDCVEEEDEDEDDE